MSKYLGKMITPVASFVPFLAVAGSGTMLSDEDQGFRPPTHGLLAEYPLVSKTKDLTVGFEDLYLLTSISLKAQYAKKKVQFRSTKPYLKSILKDVELLLNIQDYTMRSIYTKNRSKMGWIHIQKASYQRQRCLDKLNTFLFKVCEIESTKIEGIRVPIPIKARDAYLMIKDLLDGTAKNIMSVVLNQSSKPLPYPKPSPAVVFRPQLSTVPDNRTIVLDRK